jgi:hypothetical protein
MNRDTLITVLLVIAGIVLAFVLFGAGVRWKSKTSAGRPSASIAAPAERTDPNRAAERPHWEGTMSNSENAVPTLSVLINGSVLSQRQLQALFATYGASISPAVIPSHPFSPAGPGISRTHSRLIEPTETAVFVP